MSHGQPAAYSLAERPLDVFRVSWVSIPNTPFLCCPVSSCPMWSQKQWNVSSSSTDPCLYSPQVPFLNACTV